MQYASDEELRIYLTLNGSTPPVDFGTLLTEITDLFIQEQGFAFGASAECVLDSSGRERLYLPPPGAETVNSVSEDGIDLEQADWELDPKLGLFLTRLDSNEQPTTWAAGRRNIIVIYVATAVPPSLTKQCKVEAVNAWNSRQAGKSGRTGVTGVNDRVYPRDFAPETVHLLRRLKNTYDPMQVAGR